METGESILDAIFDEDCLEDVQEVEMMDVEGVLVEQDSQSDLGQNIGRDCRAEKQESCSKSRRRRSKKKNREKKASSGQKVTDINRFVLDTGRRLQEKETYLMHTAVGCLGISALDDLVKELLCLLYAVHLGSIASNGFLSDGKCVFVLLLLFLDQISIAANAN